MQSPMSETVATEVSKAAFPTAVVAAHKVFNFTLDEWLVLATLAYIALQSGYLIWKWRREHRAGRRRK